jgi:replicative DNA helicase
MDRPMPSTLEAEKSVLGSLLTWPDAYDRVATIVEAEDFFSEAHRHIFTALARLEGRGVDMMLVVDALRREGRLQDVGGVAAVAALTDTVPDTANVEKYAQLVKEASLRRRAIVECHRLQKAAYDYSQPIGEIAAEGAQLFSEFAGADRRGPVSMRQIGQRTQARLEASMLREQWLTGITTGIAGLDGYTLGFQRGVLSVGGARPRVGKTAWTISTLHQAIAAGHRVLYFELDMSEAMFGNRVLAYLSGVPSFKIRSGQGLGEEEKERIKLAVREMYEVGDRLMADYATREINRLTAIVRREARKGLDLVIVDHIGHVRGGQGKERYLQVGDVSSRLIEVAGETNTAILALVQLKREADAREPDLSDLRESGNLEQDARLVVLLDRPSLRGADVPACHMEMFVPKNEGEAGHKIAAHFDLSRQRVTGDGTCNDCRGLQPSQPREYRQTAFG